MYEREDDSYDRIDNQNRQEESVMDRNNQQRKNIPVRTHILKIDDYLNELRADISNSVKNGQILRSENMTLEHKAKESCNSSVKVIMEDLFNFERELKRTIESDKNDTENLKNDINTLTMEKCNIEKRRIGLDSRLRECENDVGYEFN